MIRPSLKNLLKDYCTLFIFRLEKICFDDYMKPSFEHSHMNAIYEFEEKVPRRILQKIVFELTSPRFDLNDVMFFHPLKND